VVDEAGTEVLAGIDEVEEAGTVAPVLVDTAAPLCSKKTSTLN
jgi:hypothetical protein